METLSQRWQVHIGRRDGSEVVSRTKLLEAKWVRGPMTTGRRRPVRRRFAFTSSEVPDVATPGGIVGAELASPNTHKVYVSTWGGLARRLRNAYRINSRRPDTSSFEKIVAT
jgi:hypothetical protein